MTLFIGNYKNISKSCTRTIDTIRFIDNTSRTLEYTGTERYGVFHYTDAAYAYIVNNANLAEHRFAE